MELESVTLTSMADIVVKKAGCRCERCGHEWVPRAARNAPKSKQEKADVVVPPRQCPKCKTAWWDTPPSK